MADSHPPYLAHHFRDIDQQRESQSLGMWAFLAQEVMFFAGLFCMYTVYRYMYPGAWEAGSRSLYLHWGFVNTLILLTSSYTVARAVHACQEDRQNETVMWLWLTVLLACGFCGVKTIEYGAKFEHHLFPGPDFHFSTDTYPKLTYTSDQVELFYGLYFITTGLHALHVIIGIVLIGIVAICAQRGWYRNGNYMPVELTGLYWHFVDIVWIFLFPCLYLINRT